MRRSARIAAKQEKKFAVMHRESLDYVLSLVTCVFEADKDLLSEILRQQLTHIGIFNANVAMEVSIAKSHCAHGESLSETVDKVDLCFICVFIEIMETFLERHTQTIKARDIDISNICPICRAIYELDEVVVPASSVCQHIFHLACLTTWVDRGHESCPLCRGRIGREATWVCRPDRIELFKQREIQDAINHVHRNLHEQIPWIPK